MSATVEVRVALIELGCWAIDAARVVVVVVVVVVDGGSGGWS